EPACEEVDGAATVGAVGVGDVVGAGEDAGPASIGSDPAAGCAYTDFAARSKARRTEQTKEMGS
ncbi:MAG TPA: hypothetical protein PKO07_26495, partial [Pseudomonadota bacterium]|nr:hypothetical protein [Pseudomonadota bacterium]